MGRAVKARDENLPARGLPLLYLGTAHGALAIACLFAASWPQAVAGFFYHSWLIGLVHLVVTAVDRLTPAVLQQMRHHSGPANTREQVLWVERFAADAHARRAAIVVSRVQAARVAALAAREGVTIPIIAAALDREPATSGIWRLLPSYAALCASRDGLYEHAALRYYRWRGWI